ncbi:MAG: membrane protein insertase YidC [Candidatus Omnitrophica bacterium]|nr:membrane protein insertase YidC [Candidatus Omnitrophota bacterium]
MEKRLLLAVVLSIVVMLLYPLFIGKVNSPPTGFEETPSRLVEKREVVETRAETMEREAPEVSEPMLPEGAISGAFRNRTYELGVSNIGGSIQKIRIKDGKRLDIDLVEGAIYQAGILSIEGKGALAGLSSQPFEIKEDTATLYAEKSGIVVEKNIRFLRDKHALTASIKITNNSGATQALSFEITTGSNISNKEAYESRFISADVLYEDGKFKKVAGGNFKKYNRLYQNNIKWLALKNKYYSIIARPDFTTSGVFTKNIKGSPVVGFIVDDERVLPGETRTYNFLLYIGPTDVTELEKVDPSFGKALNFGIFTSIGLVLLSVLKFFYSLSHNYGVAILLLTCCVSFLLFPLSFKSLKSMRRLQELQPQIEKVRTQHKDNPHKLNKEIMELYKRYKVNPMGGCFPMLLQMPIFIALYQTLMRSVELKGASFLWIKDLSMPDAAFHLPFNIPILGNAINLLPILMIGAMIVQQKLSQAKTSAAQTDQQKMMTSVMPIMFGFIFYSLPSGLVLYWLTNTVLTSTLQYLCLRKT